MLFKYLAWFPMPSGHLTLAANIPNAQSRGGIGTYQVWYSFRSFMPPLVPQIKMARATSSLWLCLWLLQPIMSIAKPTKKGQSLANVFVLGFPIFMIPRHNEDRASPSPGGLSTPPARRGGRRHPFFRRAHRGLLCGRWAWRRRAAAGGSVALERDVPPRGILKPT